MISDSPEKILLLKEDNVIGTLEQGECVHVERPVTLQIQGKEDTTLYVFEKEAVCDGLTDWIREYCPKLNFVVILRSLVVGKKESRKIKWKLTTKDKLREARDRERYLGR